MSISFHRWRKRILDSPRVNPVNAAPMWFGSIDELHHAGFKGFHSIAELRITCLGDVPREKGVYVVVRDSREPVRILPTSPAGHFKGKSPTVSTDLPTRKWVRDAFVVYIGKAGSENERATLRSRLTAYLNFGSGMPVGHWGGRYIGQLADATDLVVWWKPQNVEKRILVFFLQFMSAKSLIQ